MTTTKKAPTGALTSIAIEKIRPNPFQPRTSFDPAEIKKLAASLESSGLLQPISVRSVDDGYELLAGERRTRAAESLGWTSIPAILRAFADAEMAVLGLVENLQRADLDPLDEAEGLKRLADELHWSQAKIAEETGIPRSTVGDRLRALELPDAWLALLRKGEIQFSHTPAIHRYRELPAQAHEAAIEDMRGSYGLGDESAGPISVEDFENELRAAYRSELHPLSELPSGYDGIVITVKQWSDAQPRKYAADRAKWEPLLEAKRAADAKKARAKTKRDADETSSRPKVDYAAQEKKNREKAAKLTVAREAQLNALLARLPAAWDASLWRFVVEQLAGSGGYTTMAVLYAQVEPEKSSDYNKMEKAVHAHLAAADVATLQGLALRVLLARETKVSPYDLNRKPKHLAAFAQLLGTSLGELAPSPNIPTQPEAAPAAPSKKAAKREAKKARRAAPDFMKLQYASPALVAVIGADPMPRTGVTMALWKYIKKHGLQDTKNRRMINADDLMRPIFGKDQISMFDMTKAVNKHLKETPWDLGDITGTPRRARKKAFAAADTEVPVRVTDDGVQEIRAAAEHDEAEAAGSGDDANDDLWDAPDDVDGDFDLVDIEEADA